MPKVTVVDETLVGVGAWLQADEGRSRIENVRIGLCSVCPTAIRARGSEEFLKGKKIEEGVLREAGEIAAKECMPRARGEYRREMVKVLVRRALGHAFQKIK